MPGGHSTKSSRVYFTDQPGSSTSDRSTEACRKFARKKGDDCRFRHADPPSGSNGTSGKSNNDVKCFTCGKGGHRASDCNEACSFCGKTGHGQAKCFALKKAAEAYQKAAQERSMTTTSAPATNTTVQPAAGQQKEGAKNASFCSISVDGLEIPIELDASYCATEAAHDTGANGFDVVYKTHDIGPESSFEVIYDEHKPSPVAVVSQEADAPSAAAFALERGGALQIGKSTVAQFRHPRAVFQILFFVSLLISIFALLSSSYFFYNADFDARASTTLHENFTHTADMNVQSAVFSVFDDEPHTRICGPFRLLTPGGGCDTFRALASDYEEIIISPLQRQRNAAPFVYENDQSTPVWAEAACLLVSVICLFSLPAAICSVWIHKMGASFWRSTRRLLRHKFPSHRSSDWPGTCRFPTLQFRLPAVKGTHSRGRFGT